MHHRHDKITEYFCLDRNRLKIFRAQSHAPECTIRVENQNNEKHVSVLSSNAAFSKHVYSLQSK